MNIMIRKLHPTLLDDYLAFFDYTPHSTNLEEHKCYCVCWSNENHEGKDFSTAEKRRSMAIDYVRQSKIQGFLAFYNEKVVGWCNVNTKSDCLMCYSWQNHMRKIRTNDAITNARIKSIFCFALAPEMRGKGIATMLLKHVCEDAKEQGYDYVEAYPNKVFINTEEDYMGPIKLYEKLGFIKYYEADQKVVMRKKLN